MWLRERGVKRGWVGEGAEEEFEAEEAGGGDVAWGEGGGSERGEGEEVAVDEEAEFEGEG